MQPTYDLRLVLLSVLVAMFASFVALNLAHSVTFAKGRARLVWLPCGSIAMGFGIWSMHFVGMLAFSMPGMTMAYDIPLMVSSVLVAIAASTLALLVISKENPKPYSTKLAALAMGVAIAGMHYIGMASMRMSARIEWNIWLVVLSVFIAIVSSYVALNLAFRSRKDLSSHGFKFRILGGMVMGLAIAGMHYTGMFAATFHHAQTTFNTPDLIVTSSLVLVVTGATLFILGLALISTLVDRAFAKRVNQTQTMARLYDQGQEALKALKEERELRELFISSLTHDLRTPVTAAKMNAQLLHRHLSADPTKHKLTTRIEDNLDRMEKMIQDLLDAHRISAKQQLPIKAGPCDLVQITKETLEDLASVHGDRFQLKTELPHIIGNWDREYFRRVVENLSSNAVKYGQPRTPVTIKLNTTSTFVELGVHNFGEPISENERKNLFALFHRSQTAQASGSKGWGIGLALVKGVAEAHGGGVTVESNEVEGTTFAVRFSKSLPEIIETPTKKTKNGIEDGTEPVNVNV